MKGIIFYDQVKYNKTKTKTKKKIVQKKNKF